MSLSNAGGNRKSLAVFSIVCMLLACFVGVLPVNASGKTTLTASEVKTEKGNTVEVDFQLEENAGIWGLKFKVGYDHSVLTLASVKNGSIFSDEDITLPESLDKEQYVFFACSTKLKNITKSGTVVTLKFNVAKDVELKSYPVTVSVTQAIDASGKDVNIKAQDGSVKVVKSVRNGKDSAAKSDADGGLGDTEKDIENDTEKDTEQEKDQDKDDGSTVGVNGKETSGDQTENSKSKTGTVLTVIAIIVALCVAGVLLFMAYKKRRKKRCKRKRRSKE